MMKVHESTDQKFPNLVGIRSSSATSGIQCHMFFQSWQIRASSMALLPPSLWHVPIIQARITVQCSHLSFPIRSCTHKFVLYFRLQSHHFSSIYPYQPLPEGEMWNVGFPCMHVPPSSYSSYFTMSWSSFFSWTRSAVLGGTALC